jgi:hypothetical protein
MDIVNVLQPFAATISPENRVTITIGKHVGKKFHTSNKIFFDFLKEYLNKNGWFIKDQYVAKYLHLRPTPHFLKCTLSATPSVVLGLDAPVTLATTHYTKSHEHSYIFHGLYFDISCHQCLLTLTPSDLPDLPPLAHATHVQEETTLLNKHLCSIDVLLTVNKAFEPPHYNVQVQLARCHSDLDNEELRALFDIIDLTMCKYKKIDKTFHSTFN